MLARTDANRLADARIVRVSVALGAPHECIRRSNYSLKLPLGNDRQGSQ